MLSPFISYYGGKGALRKLYPKPKYGTIVEPFAGAASYSLMYHRHDVLLIEKYEPLAKLWKWLIEEATKEEILALPTSIPNESLSVKKLDIREEAKMLIGWWVNAVHCTPTWTPSAWMRDQIKSGGPNNNFWGVNVRRRIAKQVECIKHWRVHHGDFSDAPKLVDGPVTWFVDPPYQVSGHHYPEGAKKIDFDTLGDWCQSLNGQVMVCEQEGADWLPFRSLATFSRGGLKGAKTGREVVWLSDESQYRRSPQGFGMGKMVHVQDIPQNEAWQKSAKWNKKLGKA